MVFVKESLNQLMALESHHPLMATRLRLLQILCAFPQCDVSSLINQMDVSKFEIERWVRMYHLGGLNFLLDPRTLTSPPPPGDKTISGYAEEELLRLYNNHPRQVGSAVIADYRRCVKTGKPIGNAVEDCSVFQPYPDFAANVKDWAVTDCFTYVKNVLRYAFESIGQRTNFNKLNQADRGTVLAQILNGFGWKSYLCLRDTENPYDGLEKHTKKYKEAVKTNKWWGVNLSGFIVNYRPNPNPPLNRQTTKVDADSRRKYEALSQVNFAVCVFTEGLHTALFSKGEIYEVHWASLSEQSKIANPNYNELYRNTLYEKTIMEDFGWEEILLTVPPDNKVSLI